MTELKQQALHRIDKVLKTEEHPPARKTFNRLKDLQQIARKVASEEEEKELDDLEDPEILESDLERMQKHHRHLEVCISILDNHGLYNPEESNDAA